ncbi:MAG: SUF system Fe-S cluster assembly regulator [Rhodospirillales bacterium]|nr:SUF system Fe-S cluster assembly regulator [Rhodospirillales bacterium]
MLKLTRFADYGVVLMTHIAGSQEVVRTSQSLSDATGIPTPTVSKLLSSFARAGLLQAVRGAKGGFRLARNPQDISVADIISVVDGPIALTQCLEAGASGCDLELLCPSRYAWGTINQAVRNTLESLSIADLQFPAAGPFDVWEVPNDGRADRTAVGSVSGNMARTRATIG